jgi:hypothetical protein
MNIQEKFLTASDWIKLEVYSEPENFKINSELKNVFDTNLKNSIENLFVKAKDNGIVEEFSQFLAYIYQMTKCKSVLRSKIIEDEGIDAFFKPIETETLNREIVLINTIDSFAREKEIVANGSAGIELGTSTAKIFKAQRVYLILKIYIENIYSSLLKFISSYAVYGEARNLAKSMEAKEVEKIISLTNLRNFVKFYEIKDQDILDSIMGSELLILSAAASEKYIKESLYAVLSLIKTKDTQIIERGLFNFYSLIDNSIEDTFNKIGFDTSKSKDLVDRVKFASRKLC